ncbi:DUF5329 family protein [Candidatus Omnitrophota bacterium]
MRLLYVFLVVLCVGCAMGSPLSGRIDISDSEESYFVEDDIEQTFAYQLYESAYKDSNAEISYLINLARYSSLGFCRNNQVYTGDEGARWLEYKMTLFADEVETAEDFIYKIANCSRKTGKLYYILYPDNSKCLVTTIYTNELRRLRAVEKKKEKQRKREAEKIERERQERERTLESADNDTQVIAVNPEAI